MSWSIFVKGKRDLVQAKVDKEAAALIDGKCDPDQVTVARNLIAHELQEHDADAIVSVEAIGSISVFRDASSGKKTTSRNCSIKVERLWNFLME
jgi:hypothetical protein